MRNTFRFAAELPLLLLLLLPLVPACASNAGPFDDLPLEDTRIIDGLDAPVYLARDRHGVWHVRGETLGDVAFANGYLHARDRFWQLELIRRAASGRLAELFGTLRPETIAVDLQARVHGMRRYAQEAYAELLASSDPADRMLATSLERYAAGVNQYRDELVAGEHQAPASYGAFLPLAVFEPWSPVDSLAIGRFQAWNLSFDGYELEATAALERARERGLTELFADLLPTTPMDPVATLPGFLPAGRPRHGGAPDAGAAGAAGAAAAARRAPGRAPLPPALVDAAAAFLAPRQLSGGLMSRDRRDGSNNWVVGGALTGGGALLANDPHLQLVSPSLLYFIHLSAGDDLEVAGAGFPGVPGVVLGHNRHLAWGGTVVAHDVTDFYDEHIVACSGAAAGVAAGPAGGDCVSFRGALVPIERRVEEIAVGLQGSVIRRLQVPIEVVPHHGPILPTLVDGAVVPRSGDRAISVRWTGYAPTRESTALLRLWRSRTVEEGMAAFSDFGIGAQNWVLADDQGNIGWTTHARVPWRSAACFTFDALTAPDGVAPYLIVPGDGSCEWEGFMEPGTLPHAYNPAQGFLATANADPIGLTHGGQLAQPPRVDGRPYYLAAFYDPGLRVGRITRRLQELAAGGTIALEKMATLQSDARANDGVLFAPHIVAASDALAEELAAPGIHPDLSAFAADLPATRRDELAQVALRLRAWSFDTPAATREPRPAELADSVATSIFSAWMVAFLEATLRDEADAVGIGVSLDYLATAALRALEGRPQLCDDRTTIAVTESCRLIVLRSLDRALTALASADGFGSADVDSWRWGKLHRVTLSGLLPLPELSIPPPDDPDPELRAGYPRHGTPYSVDVASGGYDDLDFSFRHGPSMRHLVAFTEDGPVTWLALPGGQSYDLLSPHFRDLMDLYWSQNRYFTLPWKVDEVRAAGEARVELRPH